MVGASLGPDGDYTDLHAARQISAKQVRYMYIEIGFKNPAKSLRWNASCMSVIHDPAGTSDIAHSYEVKQDNDPQTSDLDVRPILRR